MSKLTKMGLPNIDILDQAKTKHDRAKSEKEAALRQQWLDKARQANANKQLLERSNLNEKIKRNIAKFSRASKPPVKSAERFSIRLNDLPTVTLAESAIDVESGPQNEQQFLLEACGELKPAGVEAERMDDALI